MSRANRQERIDKIRIELGYEPLYENWYSVLYSTKVIGIVVAKRLADDTERSFIGIGDGKDVWDDIYKIIALGARFYGKIER